MRMIMSDRYLLLSPVNFKTTSFRMKRKRLLPNRKCNTDRVSDKAKDSATFLLMNRSIDCSGSGMNLLDIRTRNWSGICLEATAPHLDRLLGAPLPSASVLVRLVHTGLVWPPTPGSRSEVNFNFSSPSCPAGPHLLLLRAAIRFLRALRRGGFHRRQPR